MNGVAWCGPLPTTTEPPVVTAIPPPVSPLLVVCWLCRPILRNSYRARFRYFMTLIHAQCVCCLTGNCQPKQAAAFLVSHVSSQRLYAVVSAMRSPTNDFNCGDNTVSAYAQTHLESCREAIETTVLRARHPPDYQWGPSQVYGFDDFLAAVRLVVLVGIGGEYLYIGEDDVSTCPTTCSSACFFSSEVCAFTTLWRFWLACCVGRTECDFVAVLGLSA